MAKLPFDKLRLRMNIADMAQKFLALLIMIPRFGFYVLKDRRSADVVELPCYHGNRVLDPGQNPTYPANFIDSADHGRLHFSIHGANPGAATG